MPEVLVKTISYIHVTVCAEEEHLINFLFNSHSLKVNLLKNMGIKLQDCMKGFQTINY